jgi:hypothetical protein
MHFIVTDEDRLASLTPGQREVRKMIDEGLIE